MSVEHFDVVIVGAGLSGIGAGYRLQTRCPGKRFAILEARSEIGGTWDLFRYPGIRSDSDMFTLGYPFRPWKEAKANDETVQYTCDFLYGCTGYYRYDAGFTPTFPGADTFRGQLVHPQHWPEDLDYCGKRVVVIGSGATAVTLVPAMSHTAGHVTMLQRSPTYILSLHARDPIADLLRRVLPEGAAHGIVRWKNILLSLGIYQLSRRAPNVARHLFRTGAEKNLPQGYDIDTHFNPRYQPWDQRLCLVPDSDLFQAISAGRASIVTGQIDTFTENGILLQSGQKLEADIIVSATGWQMLALGGVRLTVDATPVDPGHAFVYKGVMLSNVPNFAFCVGYTNASWTLRADLASIFVCRLLKYMDRHGYRTSVPACDPASLESKPLLDLTSGYVVRAATNLPKQASVKPWFIRQNYILDMLAMKLGKVDDGILQFGTGHRQGL